MHTYVWDTQGFLIDLVIGAPCAVGNRPVRFATQEELETWCGEHNVPLTSVRIEFGQPPIPRDVLTAVLQDRMAAVNAAQRIAWEALLATSKGEQPQLAANHRRASERVAFTESMIVAIDGALVVRGLEPLKINMVKG